MLLESAETIIARVAIMITSVDLSSQNSSLLMLEIKMMSLLINFIT